MSEGRVIIETERLILREITQRDFDELCKILKDNAVMYAYEGAFNDQEVQQWLDKQLMNYANYGCGLYIVTLKSIGLSIGQCGITIQKCADTSVHEIGYLFQKAFWHNGYATEAAIACKNYAFEVLGIDKVYSIIRDSNVASQKVALRNGMSIEDYIIKHYRGIDIPHIVFSCTKKQYKTIATFDK